MPKVCGLRIVNPSTQLARNGWWPQDEQASSGNQLFQLPFLNCYFLYFSVCVWIKHMRDSMFKIVLYRRLTLFLVFVLEPCMQHTDMKSGDILSSNSQRDFSQHTFSKILLLFWALIESLLYLHVNCVQYCSVTLGTKKWILIRADTADTKKVISNLAVANWARIPRVCSVSP